MLGTPESRRSTVLSDRPRRRRRSLYVGLSAITLSATLAGCGRDDPPKVYASVQDCKAEHPAQACQDAWQASVGEQQSTAPQYSQKAQCEAQYGVGHCETRTGEHGSFFMPMMAGFMIGQMMNQRRDNGYYGGGYIGHPVAYAPGGGYRAPPPREGESFYGRGGGFTSRGGFGETAGSRGGFGE
jgi:uncharacterized protein YgiB involved in biofilm formation